MAHVRVTPVQPRRVAARFGDTRAAPRIDLNMLSYERDMNSLIAGVRIFDQPVLARFGGRASDADLRADGSG